MVLNTIKKVYSLFILMVLISFSCSKSITTDQEVGTSQNISTTFEKIPIFKIGNKTYDRNKVLSSLNTYAYTDGNSLDSSFEDYMFKQRIYQEAVSQGYLKNQNILDEIKTYGNLIAEEQIQDSLLTEQMILEAYRHSKMEVNASHLFIGLANNASPRDTLFVYDELIRIRDIAIKTGSFDSLTTLYSQDRRTMHSGGNLGWFSALQLVYPIEKTAFSMNIGDLSFPVRSEMGYHLIKLHGKRDRRKNLKVRHLLVAIPADADSNVKEAKRKYADSLHTIVNRGDESFVDLIKSHSDDYKTKSLGGILPTLSIKYKLEQTFEDAAYQLDSMAISPVIETSIGFHIIQNLGTVPFPTLSEDYDYFKAKVTTDSRGRYIKERSLAKYANLLNFKDSFTQKNELSTYFDESLLLSEWKYSASEKNPVLFQHKAETKTRLNDFLRFVEDRQSFDPVPDDTDLKRAVLYYYRKFRSKVFNDLAQKYVLENSPSAKYQLSLVKEDLVNAKFLNKVVIEKAVADTLGQRRFYNNHKNLFKKEARAYATIVQSDDDALIQTLLNTHQLDKPYRLKRGIKALYFSKNFYFLGSEDKRRLAGLFSILQSNQGYIVEIGGHRDVNEEPYVSRSRIEKVVDYLVGLGLSITRIKETDYGDSKLSDRFDWEKNQRVSIQFFSADILDLLPTLDPSKQKVKKIERKWYTQSQIPDIWDSLQEEKAMLIENPKAYIDVRKKEKEGFLSLREVRGEVINRYQDLLMQELKTDLATKYPILIQDAEYQKVKASLLNKINAK